MVLSGMPKAILVRYLIFLQSLVATLGSLYYSTFGDPVANLMASNAFPADAGFIPCELCWFARILMYPIVFISFIGLLKDDESFTDYILPMSVIGIGLEIYHYGLQKFNFATFFKCTSAVPCSALQVNYFGFITIPFLALLAFIFITILCVWNMKLRSAAKKVIGEK